MRAGLQMQYASRDRREGSSCSAVSLDLRFAYEDHEDLGSSYPGPWFGMMLIGIPVNPSKYRAGVWAVSRAWVASLSREQGLRRKDVIRCGVVCAHSVQSNKPPFWIVVPDCRRASASLQRALPIVDTVLLSRAFVHSSVAPGSSKTHAHVLKFQITCPPRAHMRLTGL